MPKMMSNPFNILLVGHFYQETSLGFSCEKVPPLNKMTDAVLRHTPGHCVNFTNWEKKNARGFMKDQMNSQQKFTQRFPPYMVIPLH